MTLHQTDGDVDWGAAGRRWMDGILVVSNQRSAVSGQWPLAKALSSRISALVATRPKTC